MRPAQLNLIGPRAIMAGDPYRFEIQITGPAAAGIDFTEWDFAAHLRTAHPTTVFGETPPADAEFTVDISATVGFATITLDLDQDTTAALDHRARWVWDLQGIDADGDTHTLLRGSHVTVLPEVTIVEGT